MNDSHKLFSSLSEEHTLADAMEDIAKNNRPFLVVEDAGHHPAGLITSHDVLQKLSSAAQDKNSNMASMLNTRLSELVSPEVLVVDSKTTMAEAARIMCSSPHQHLPVTGFLGSSIDDDSRWIGIISAKDLLKWTTEHQ